MPARRVAAIDVGTNSFLLLILERDEAGAERVVLDRSDITRLGEGVDAGRRLQPAAMDRCAAQLAAYARLCAQHEVAAMRAVGTSALRDAANRDDFLNRVRTECAVDIEVISGEREAELAYAAVAAARARPGEPLMNVDIGGGSTELVVGTDHQIESRVSLQIGAVRLTDRVGATQDPPSEADLTRFRELASAALAEVRPVRASVVGTGGTITTLAAIHHGLTTYDGARVASTRLDVEIVEALLARLAALTLAQRRTVPGLPPKRADVILGGAVLVRELLGRLEVESMGVNPGGLRFALAREALQSLA